MLTCVDDFHVTIVVVKFNDWLLEKMRERGWTQAEMARQTKLTRQSIANYMNGRIPDRDVLKVIAKSIKVPLEEVYRAAGLLPVVPEPDAYVQRMLHKLRNPDLTDEDRELFEADLDARIRLRESHNANVGRKDRKKISQT